MLQSQVYCNAVERTVRVGFIPDGNFYSIDEFGNLSGYNYDYLLKLAQYTNWNYEFVIIQEENLDQSYNTAREMLDAGELDLLGSHSSTEETRHLYEFGEKHYAVVRTTLSTLANNTNITKNNFFLQENLRVALVDGAENNNEMFFDIMENYGITPLVTYVADREEALALLVEEKADVMVNTDFSVYHDTLLNLESGNPIPLYFVATKGNTTLIEELDQGITQLEITNASIIEQLQGKYFGTGHQGDLIRTKAEEKALEAYDYLTIGLLTGKEPYQFENSFTQAGVPSGISTETLDLISQIINIKFRYVWADTASDMLEKMENEEIDIFATLPTDYDLAKDLDITLSAPYLSNGAVLLRQNGSGKLFTSAYYHFVSDTIPFYDGSRLYNVPTISETLIDISENGESILYSDPFVAKYFLQKLNIFNVDVQSVSNITSNVSMGIGKHVDPVITGLLNHAILHLDQYTVDEIVFSNMMIDEGITVKEFISKNSVQIMIGIVLFFSAIVSMLVYHAKKFRDLSRKDGLTHLYNAGYFHKYAGEVTKKLHDGSLILIDIDYFKQVNDAHGHQMGDTIIKTVASALQHNFRDGDMVARLGGDEFVVLVDYKTTVDELETRCEKILKQLVCEGQEVPVTLSIGGFIFEKETAYEELYRKADQVLYEVKESGRNGYKFMREDAVVEGNRK